MQLHNVTVTVRGNVYFDGRVVSHTVNTPDGKRHTVGVILPGSYHFGTEAPERMEIVAGSCSVRLDGSETVATYGEGSVFEVAGNSGFTIEVGEGSCHYLCSFLA